MDRRPGGIIGRGNLIQWTNTDYRVGDVVLRSTRRESNQTRPPTLITQSRGQHLAWCTGFGFQPLPAEYDLSGPLSCTTYIPTTGGCRLIWILIIQIPGLSKVPWKSQVDLSCVNSKFASIKGFFLGIFFQIKDGSTCRGDWNAWILRFEFFWNQPLKIIIFARPWHNHPAGWVSHQHSFCLQGWLYFSRGDHLLRHKNSASWTRFNVTHVTLWTCWWV